MKEIINKFDARDIIGTLVFLVISGMITLGIILDYLKKRKK